MYSVYVSQYVLYIRFSESLNVVRVYCVLFITATPSSFLLSTQNLAEPSDVLIECLTQFSSVLTDLAPFLDSPNTSSSVLLVEVGPLSNIPVAIKTPQGSPLLHKLAIANSFMQMFVYIFKACNSAYVVSMHTYTVQCIY